MHRAVHKYGKTQDFMLSKRRNKATATEFFARALEVSELPRKTVVDKSGVNTVGIKAVNKMFKGFGCPTLIEMARQRHLNSIVEKAYASASATLEGIEVAQMIRKGQFEVGLCPFKQFAKSAV